MESEIFGIGKDGARLTVYGAVDAQSTVMLSVGLFFALVLALAVYAKVLR